METVQSHQGRHLMPRLYQYHACPFSWKVRAVLYYHKVPFETVEVNPLNKRELAFSKDYKKVPVFVDSDGTQINESESIMRYIDNTYGDPSSRLFAGPESDQNSEREVLSLSEELVQALPAVIYETLGLSWSAFAYIGKVSNFSWLQRSLIRIFGALVMYRVAKTRMKKMLIKDPVANLNQVLEKFEHILGEKAFLQGDHITAGDLATWGILRSIFELSCFEYVRQRDRIYTWYIRVESQLLRSSLHRGI